MISRIAAARRTFLVAFTSHHTCHRLSFQIWRNYASRNILKLEERGLWADIFPDSKYANYICILVLVSLMYNVCFLEYIHLEIYWSIPFFLPLLLSICIKPVDSAFYKKIRKLAVFEALLDKWIIWESWLEVCHQEWGTLLK